MAFIRSRNVKFSQENSLNENENYFNQPKWNKKKALCKELEINLTFKTSKT